MRIRILTLGILFMLMFSAIIPILPGENVRISNEKEILSTTFRDGGLMDSAWPMYCHDAHHTGRSQYSTFLTHYSEKWWFRTTHDEVCLDDCCFINIDASGTIYLTDREGYIYAVNPDGSLKWIYDDDGADEIEGHPVIDNDGNLYFGTEFTDFISINTSDGTVNWELDFEYGLSIFTSPVIDDNGIIYFAISDNSDGEIYACYPNGTIKWEFTINEHIYSSLAIGNDGTVYCGADDGFFYAIYPNGELRWKVKLMDSFRVVGSPTIAEDGTIYIANIKGGGLGYLNAVNPDDGSIIWSFEIDSDYYVTPSLGGDGTIYLFSSGKLYAIYPTGTQKWVRDVDITDISMYYRYFKDPVISADGTIYVTSYNNIIAFNPSGSIRWSETYDIPLFWIESSPVIGEDGTIYLGICHWVEVESPWYRYTKILYLHAYNTQDENAPSTPIINGPKKGKMEELYNFTIVSTDPNDDDIYYYVNWGVESYYIPMVGWVPSDIVEYGPYPSGEVITINHSWPWSDIFTISVRAQDTNNLVSSWSYHKIKLKKSRALHNPLFYCLLEQFPILHRLLSLIRV